MPTMIRSSLHRCAPLTLLMLLALSLHVGCSGEERFPDRPIMLICPWSAGGGTDTVSRKVAAMLEQELGVPVNVVNATGGSGVTGHTRGALGYAPPWSICARHFGHSRAPGDTSRPVP